MPKISRTVVYTLVGSVVAYAVVWLTQPQAPPSKSSRYRNAASVRRVEADGSGITDEDRNARFPRYTGEKRDPFTPAISLALPGADLLARAGRHGRAGGWALTGINIVNGIPSAVLENSSTGASVFLQPGDKWNDLRVRSVGDDSVVLANAVGLRATMTFEQPDFDTAVANAANPNAPQKQAAAKVPSLSDIVPLPSIQRQPIQPAPDQQQTPAVTVVLPGDDTQNTNPQ